LFDHLDDLDRPVSPVSSFTNAIGRRAADDLDVLFSRVT
jgi:hypothetical protein